jgi:glycerophosphoryl diester phosphodiesterase
MRPGEMIIFGHKGAAGYAPENTLASFQEALQRDADWIEIDVHNVGGELMVLHDYRLERTTNGTGLLTDHDPEYIRTLDAGKGAKVPLLHEVFDLVDRQIGINIEIKSPDTAKPVLDLIDKYIRNHGWSIDNFSISSFNQFELKRVRQLNQVINIGILTFGLPIHLEYLKRALNPSSINVSIEFINRQFVQLVHRLEMAVYVFTVDYTDDIQRMIAIGADGIFTDYPDRVKAIMRQKTNAKDGIVK